MKTFVTALMLVASMLLPQASQAFSGKGEVTQLPNGVFLYRETISRTATNNELRVPIEAGQSMLSKTSDESLQYQILIDGTPWAGLEAYAAVVSQAQIEGEQYVLQEGETAEFTLFVLLKLPPSEIVRPTESVTFEVTSFPETNRQTSPTYTLTGN